MISLEDKSDNAPRSEDPGNVSKFSPSITMSDGSSITPTNKEWLIAYSIKGCKWAIEALDKMNNQIYAVYAKHLDRNQLLGYCISDSYDDIEAYYKSKMVYGLEIEAVYPIRIPAGYAAQKASLLKQKQELEAQLEKLDEQIKSIEF